MAERYSVYEAKSRFSEVIREVRLGRRVTITYRGEPIAEVAPIARGERPLAERLQELAESGAISRPRSVAADRFRPLARRQGALARFLAERD